jgi:hypothetical protein
LVTTCHIIRAIADVETDVAVTMKAVFKAQVIYKYKYTYFVND